MPPRKIKVVDVIKPEGYACDDNELPEAIEDIHEPIEEQSPQPVEEEVAQVTQVTQPVSNKKIVELVESPGCRKKMTKKTLKYSHAKNVLLKCQPRVFYKL